MGTVYCDNCGTSLLEETAKFCRACGKPTPLSEAATKRFDEQPSVQVPTNPFAPSLTTPAYMAPFEAPPAEQTNDLRKKRNKRNLIIVASMLAVMIFALAGLLVFLNFARSSDGVPGLPTPVGAIPNLPSGPPPPPPPPPIQPPGSPGINGPSIDPSLIYPGARQTMSINHEGGKSVLQLHSNDPTSRVADWYIAKLKVTKKVAIAGQIILQAGDIGVVIMGGDDGAQILITRGGQDR